ncbi:retrovirus-related pol polyprotein from transposon TNT 1-94 [Tanacetum coccineum]
MIHAINVSKSLWHNRLGHPADQVLVVLKDDFSLSKSIDVSAGEVFLIKTKDEVFDATVNFVKLPTSVLNVTNSHLEIDMKFYETIFSFKMRTTPVNEKTDADYASDADHLTFFDNQLSQSPYDEGRATSVIEDSVQSEHRRSSRIAILPAKLNDYVVDSKLKYRLKNIWMLTMLFCMVILLQMLHDFTFRVGNNNDNKHAFVQSIFDYSLFIKENRDVFDVLLVYVDDIVITGNCKEILENKSGFMHSSLQSHFQAALRVLRYLKGAPVTRKSISGFVVMIGDCLVSWKSKKQPTISRSLAEAEYRCLDASTYLFESIDPLDSKPIAIVLRILGSIFTSVYAGVQKLKKDTWLELQLSLVDNSKLNILENKFEGDNTPIVIQPPCYSASKTGDERNAAKLDQRLKSLIMSILPDDQMNSIINCLTAKSTWDDLILYHEGPSNVKESGVMDLKLFYNILKFKEDSPDDEEDTMSSHEYLNGLKEDYQAKALLAKSKRFFKKVSTYQSPFQPKPLSSPHKPEIRPTKDFEAKYNKVKAKLALLSSSALASKSSMVKNKGLIVEAYKWDEEEVSSDDNEMVVVKVLMALDEENDVVSKEGARNGEWVKISMRKVHTLLEIKDNNDRKVCLDYLYIDLNYVEEQRSNLLAKVLVFVKFSADNIKMTTPGVERPWLSEAKGFILPNHDTGRILPAESQRDTTNPSVDVTDSSATDYDSTDESSVCSTSLLPLKKLDGAEPISGPKTIKSILKSKFTFKDEALKCEKIDHRTCDHAEYISTMNMSQHLKSLGKALQAKKAEALKLTKAESSNANRSKNPTKSRCSRHMTSVKSYLHKYVEQPGPKADDSTCKTKGYGSIKCNVFENLNWLWHKRLAHLNFKTINKLAKQNLVIGLPSLVYSKDKPCSSCEKGKHHRASFKTKQTSSIKKCLHLLHMDLFGPVTPRSINHEKYTLVIVDEYSRYTWVYFLKKKSQAPETIMSFIKRVENQNDIKVKQLRTDNAEQNSVAERKNRTLIEAARTVLSGSVFSKQYWTESRISNISFLHVFGCPVYIHNHKDHLGKFDEKADDEAGMLTRAMAKQLSAASAHECLYVDFISEEEPKKIKQSERGINGSSVKTPMVPPNNLGPDLSGKAINETQYRDIKQILRNPALSLLKEFSGKAPQVPIFCDNTSAIAISNNLVLHSRTKHIDIRYHFIRDHVLKGDIELHFIPTQYQLADIFTKPLDELTFKRLIVELGMLNIDSKPKASVLNVEN